MATSVNHPGGAGAGAGAGSGSGGEGAGLYSAGNSDLDILDGLAEETLVEETENQGGEGAGAGEGAGGGEGEGAGAGEGEGEGAGAETVPEWLEGAPEELKGLLSAGNVSAAAKEFLKKTYEEFLGLKDGLSGDPEVAAELTDLFPGGIEDIRAAHENAQTLQREMTQFESGDPTQQAEMLSSLLQQNADAFVSMVPVGLDLLKQTLRDDWTQIASGMSREYLDTITDGKFGTFFDNLVTLGSKYHELSEANPDEAAKFAAKLGGAALQMADWWTSAKPKLGYDKAAGERTAGAAPGARTVAGARTTEINDGEMRVAIREANLFEQQLGLHHDKAINPMISKSIASEIKARGMTLSNGWQQKVLASVAKAIVKNLQADRSFQAKLTREYHRGDSKRPQNWDRSDRVLNSLINAARARAEKLAPRLVKRALDNLATLTPGKKTAAAGAGDPAAGRRSGARTPTSTPGALSDADLKNSEISDGDLLARLTGVPK